MVGWMYQPEIAARAPHIRRPGPLSRGGFEHLYRLMFAHNLRTMQELAAEGETLRQDRNCSSGRVIATTLWSVAERYLAPRTMKRRFFLCSHTHFDVLGRDGYAHVRLTRSALATRAFIARFVEQRFGQNEPIICVVPIGVYHGGVGHALSLVVENLNGRITARFINSGESHYPRRAYASIVSQLVPGYARAARTNDDENALQLLGTCTVYSIVSVLLYLDATPVISGAHVPQRSLARRKVHISRIANALAHVEGMCGDNKLVDVIVNKLHCPAMEHAVHVIWAEYRELREELRMSCGWQPAIFRELTPVPAGMPNRDEPDLLDMIARLREVYVANRGARCLHPVAVREMLRQYYWRDFYYREAEAWAELAPLSAAGRLDAWTRAALLGY